MVVSPVLANPANNAPIGTGPFRFVKWVRGSYIEYARNDDYWNAGKPHLDLAAYLKRVYTDRQFDFTVNGMSNLFDPVVGVARLYTTDNFRPGVPFTNGSHYSNPQIDGLFAQAARESDETKRKQKFAQIQRILERDLPDLNLVSPQWVTLASKRVHDHSISPDGLAASFADVWLSR